MVWVFIAVAAVGLFWLRYRNPYRRRWLLPRPAAPPVSSTEAVDRHYRHLLSGGRLGEAVVAAAAARFAELLGSGRVREIERELTPGVGFAVGVRALTRIGTPAAGEVLERQLGRRLTADPVEQSWYWADVAAGLRQLHQTSALPAVLRCADLVGDLPAGHLLAAEALAFPNFHSTLSDLSHPTAKIALRVLVIASRACRARSLDPDAMLRLGLGDRLADLSETAPGRPDPELVAAMLEAERFYRRVGQWLRYLSAEGRARAEDCALRLGHSAARRRDWLVGAPARLLARFAIAPSPDKAPILRCLAEFRSDVTALFPCLPDPDTPWWAEAVACLEWSRSPAAGPVLAGHAAHGLGSRRSWPRLPPLLRCLRGHPCRESEAVLVEATRVADSAVRRAALGSLGWWPPYDPNGVREVLDKAKTDPDDGVRHTAVAALARLGDRSALSEIELALGAEELAVRVAAIDRVADEQLSWFWPRLQELEESETPDVGLAAVEATARLREAVLGPLG